MADKHMKRCSISLIREIKIKTTIRYHLTLVRMAIIKKSTNNNCWRGCGEKRTFFHYWWECKFIQQLWNTVWRSLKKIRNKTTMTQQPHFWAYTLRKPGYMKKTQVPQLFTIAWTWKQPRCP